MAKIAFTVSSGILSWDKGGDTFTISEGYWTDSISNVARLREPSGRDILTLENDDNWENHSVNGEDSTDFSDFNQKMKAAGFGAQDFTVNSTIDVNIQDQTTDLVDLYMGKQVEELTLSSATVIDSYTVDVVDASGVSAGNYIGLKEGIRTFQALVLSVSSNTITLNVPLDNDFSTSAFANAVTVNAAVDGSTTPQVFQVKPDAGIKWDVVRVIITMVHSAEPDDTKFGGITGGLTRGILLRKTDGETKNIFYARTNGDLRIRTYDVTYTDKAGGIGTYGTGTRRTFGGQNKNGVVIRLDGDNDDALQLIVQDDLTDLVNMKICVQGHVTDE